MFSEKLATEIRALRVQGEQLSARIAELEARHPKPNPRPRSNPYNAGEPRSYASAIKAFWEKKNV